MTINLTNTGWKGDYDGIWTIGNDVVVSINTLNANEDSNEDTTIDTYGIVIDKGVTANTSIGDDSISGTGISYGEVGIFSSLGIDNRGVIDTGDGKDALFGTGTGTYIGGICNLSGSIDTGKGDDSISGTGTGTHIEGICNVYGSIDTGDGNDFISGTGGIVGIRNYGNKITTGDGDDSISGTGTYGIDNFKGSIDTGADNDILTASGGKQDFGNNGVLGSGDVFLGSGDDTLSGFGSGNIFDGGIGKDILILPLGSYAVSSAIVDNSTVVTFIRGDILMPTTGFESLRIGGQTYNFANLPDTVFG